MDIATLLGPPPAVRLTMPSAEQIATGEIWVDFDRESDSFVIYFAAHPVPGVRYDLSDDVMAIADPATGEVLGIQIEAWERRFVPQYADLNRVWPNFKKTMAPDKGWSYALRSMTVFILFLLSLVGNDETRLTLQPA